ncbi:MAG: hypothetical protein QOG60_2068 [Frankiaceae bacterium]|nr:hypothetical protein [Frankiaceae bacterium]
MQLKLAAAVALLAAGAIASPALAQGGGAAAAGLAPPVPAPAPPLLLTDHLGSTSILVNSGAPVVATASVTNNTSAPQVVSATYAQASAQVGACAMPSWSTVPMTVKAGSTASVTSKRPAPSCSGDYALTVVASSTSGVSAAPVTVVFNQFLKSRNH